MRATGWQREGAGGAWGRWAVLGWGWLLCFLWACQPSPGGGEVGGAARGVGPRIVSLSPALTQVVRALGGEAHVVAVTHYDPLKDRPVVGALDGRVEAILTHEPDWVLVTDAPSQAKIRGALEAFGQPMVVLPILSLEEMREATRVLGERLGRAQEAEVALQRLDEALEGGAEVLGAEGPRFLVVYGVEPGFVYTSGGGDHVVGLLEQLGGRPAFVGPVSARLGLERVLELAPDVIVIPAPAGGLEDREAVIRYWAPWSRIPAVARGHVVFFEDGLLAQNSPRLVEVVPILRRALEEARR